MLHDGRAVANVEIPCAAPIDAWLRLQLSGPIEPGASGGAGSPLDSNGRLIVGYRLGTANTLAGQLWLYTDPGRSSSRSRAFADVPGLAGVAGVFAAPTVVEAQIGVPQLLGRDLEAIANVGNLFPGHERGDRGLQRRALVLDRRLARARPAARCAADAPSAGIVDNVLIAPAAAALTAAHRRRSSP